MWRRHPTARYTLHLGRLEMEEKRVKAIIFDLDNTLIETRRAGEVAIQKVIMWHLNVRFYATFHCSARLEDAE